ncbi:MAG: hypothetical protein J6L88_02140 [Clostridia bacterium]|nr:hypothetical protein [Clostridia bacterium]
MNKRHIWARVVPLVLLCVLVLSPLCGCATQQMMADALAQDIDAFIAQREVPLPQGQESFGADLPRGPYFELYEDDFHGDVSFLDMEYERPDLQELESQIDKLFTVGETGDAASVVAQCDVVDELWTHAVTCYRIADIHYNMDTNDEFYEQEQSFLYEEITRMEVKLYDGYMVLIEGGYKEALIEDWGEDEVQATIDYAQLVTPESALIDARDNELQQVYYDLMDSTTITWEGRTLTLDDILEDEKIVGDAYQQCIDLYCNELAAGFEDEFMEMISMRNDQARTLGFESYAHYRNAVYDRDYSPEDVAVFREAVKTYIVPLYYDLILKSYGYDDKEALFDASFEQEELMDWTRHTLGGISGELVQAFDYMLEFDLYDIDDSDGKIDGAYTTYIDEYEAPFYLGCFNGDYYAVNEITHEFGHYASYFHNPGEGPLDLAEIDSQGLQLLMIRGFDQIYGDDVAGDAATDVLLDMMYSLITGCLYDEFQEAVYTQELSMDEIGALHAQLYEDYGLADLYYYSQHSWLLVHHNITSPYYYISYATSAVPALEIWQVAQEDYDEGVELYLSLYERDHYDDFTEVLEDLGFSDPLAPETIQSLAGSLQQGVDAYLTQDWDAVTADAA